MPARICQYQCIPLEPGDHLTEVIIFILGGGAWEKSSFCTLVKVMKIMDDP